MSGSGPGHAAANAPVVHNVVLGGDAGGKPVNLLELLMEEMPGGDRTTLMEAPVRSSAAVSAAARPNADLTAPMGAAVASRAPGPSEFTAVLQAFEPAAASAVRVPTETDRPRFETGGANRPQDSTRLVDRPRGGADGAGHTQVMSLPERSGLASNCQSAPVERVSAAAEEPALSRALRTPAPQAEPVAASAGMAGWVPWLLVAIALELFAILIVLLVGMKR